MKFLTISMIYFLQLLLGQAAEVRVVGIPEEQRLRIFAKMAPRLEFIHQREASEWRADDAAYFMQRVLLREGYSDSKTSWSLPGGNLIMLRVELGKRYTFGNLVINAEAELKRKLLDDYFFQPLIEGELVSRKNAPYLETYPAEGVANVENFLKSQGYWEAKVKLSKLEKRSAVAKMDVHLDIKRGLLHKLATPEINGVSSEAKAHLLSEMEPYTNKISSYASITAVRSIVTKYYAKQGYEFAEIKVSAGHRDGLTQLEFNVVSGNRYKVRDIAVRGNEKTVRRRFSRYLDSMRGEYYNAEQINKIENELLRTGAFKSVRITPKTVGENQLDLQVEVQEMRAKYVRSYTGYATFDGFILGTSYTDQNFLGKLQRFSARAEVNKRGLLGELSLTEPYFAGEAIRQTTRLYALTRKYDSYDIGKSGLELVFKWQPSEHYSTRLFTGVSYANVNANSVTDFELGPENYTNTSIGLEQEIDFRNNPVVPTKGFHARGLLEFGGVSGDASSSYIRTELNSSYRYQLEDKDRIVFRFNAGAIFPAESQDLPIDLKYFKGGIDSVRSFGERDMGPQSASGTTIGGEAYWDASVEYIKPYNDLLSGVVFLDSGQVFQNTSDFSFNSPSHALGLGLRLDLPIGPVRLEYGYNLNKREGEPSGALHFSIGAKF